MYTAVRKRPLPYPIVQDQTFAKTCSKRISEIGLFGFDGDLLLKDRKSNSLGSYPDLKSFVETKIFIFFGIKNIRSIKNN